MSIINELDPLTLSCQFELLDNNFGKKIDFTNAKLVAKLLKFVKAIMRIQSNPINHHKLDYPTTVVRCCPHNAKLCTDQRSRTPGFVGKFDSTTGAFLYQESRVSSSSHRRTLSDNWDKRDKEEASSSKSHGLLVFLPRGLISQNQSHGLSQG